MRVIGGSRKGQMLRLPKNISIRPTTDRTKEFIFNILGEWIEESVVLDLFAGSGNLGIEALSRGAEKSVFVEKNNIHSQIIKKNLEMTKLTSLAQVVVSDVFKYIPWVSRQLQKFDIIFADPPYDSECQVRILEILNKVDILNDDGIFILEHSSKLKLNGYTKFDLIKYKILGDTSISFYKKNRGIY